MGTLVPALGAITKTIGTFQTIGRAIEELRGNDMDSRRQEQAMRELQARQARQTSEAQAQADESRAKIALDAQEAEERRRAALKRAVAKRNARFGATGIGGAGGSREAVLLGLYDESEAEKNRRQELDKLRYGAIDNDLGNIAARNILERTQLAERQRLDNLGKLF